MCICVYMYIYVYMYAGRVEGLEKTSLAPPPLPVCGLNRVYLEAGTRVFCYLIKNKERQLPNKPYVGFWVGKAGNLNNLNIGVDPGEGVGPGI